MRARVLWTAYWAFVFFLSSVLGFVAGRCLLLVLVLAGPLNAVVGLCVRGWFCCCACFGRAIELCGWFLWPGLLERSVVEQITMLMRTKIHS